MVKIEQRPQQKPFHVKRGVMASTFYQQLGLIYKHTLLRFVYWKTTLFTIAFSAASLLLMVALKLLIERLLGDTLSGEEVFIRPTPFSWQHNTTATVILNPSLPKVLLIGDLAYSTHQNNSAAFRLTTGIPTAPWKILYSVEREEDAETLGYLVNSTENKGEFARLAQTQITLPYSKFSAQQFHRKASRQNIDDLIYDGLVNKTLQAFPLFAALNIKAYDPSVKKMHYTIQYDNASKTYASAISRSASSQFIPMSMMTYMNNLYMSNRTFGGHMVQARSAQMPYRSKSFNLDIIGQLGIFIFPMILCTLVPTFTYSIVLEKVQKLRDMQRLMGMSMGNYYLILYISQYALYLLSAFCFVIISYIFQFSFIAKNNWVIVTLTLGGWGLTTVSFSFLLSSLINNTLIASVAGYLLVLFGPITGVILENFVITPAISWQTFPIQFIYPLQITHAAVGQLNACVSGKCPSYDSIWNDPYILQSLIAIYGCAIVYMILAMYFDAVLPQSWGVRKHPFLCFGPIFNILTDRLDNLYWKSKEKLHLCFSKRSHQMQIKDNDDHIDDDVAAEIKKVRDETYHTGNTGVLFNDITKHFNGGRKKAVQNLTFGIKSRECFGLLGPNGAGKTTLISMLCGLIPVSHGTAHIVGYDIRKNMGKIHRSMGLCPQFDILWNDLTCFQHLQYYCFLKGVPIGHQKSHIKELLTKVGLWKKTRNGKVEKIYSRRAGKLSGGMKRRLSIAIALCGDPKVILLDEPTTGLDPSTKRKLWDLILEVKRDRCVILTTHSLEEADILADRIGIMALGQLKCIGSSLHLKNKFGDGYKISLTFDEMHRYLAIHFFLSIVPMARPAEMFAGRATFEVHRDSFSVGDTFLKMEAEGKKHYIKDFAINQTSLEDVFLNIITQDDIGR